MDLDSREFETRTNAEQSETPADFRVSYESDALRHVALRVQAWLEAGGDVPKNDVLRLTYHALAECLPSNATVHERFWTKVDKTEGCWIWVGGRDSIGYGAFWIGKEKRIVRAHRYSFEMVNGPIAKGLVIDHLCRNKSCVNPAHMQAVTYSENLRRAYYAPGRQRFQAQTHCPKGHEYTVAYGKQRAKRCVICATERQRRIRRRP